MFSGIKINEPYRMLKQIKYFGFSLNKSVVQSFNITEKYLKFSPYKSGYNFGVRSVSTENFVLMFQAKENYEKILRNEGWNIAPLHRVFISVDVEH